MNSLGLVLQIFLYLATFECNTTSDWLNQTSDSHSKNYVTFKLTKSPQKRLKIFLRMVGEYKPRSDKKCEINN